MRTTIFTAVVVAILAVGSLASAQSRFHRQLGNSARSTTSATGRPASSPLLRGPLATSRNTSATARRASGTSSGNRTGFMRPIFHPRTERYIARSVDRLFRAGHGSVSAPAGATRAGMREMFRGAWEKMMYGGRDVKMTSVTTARGTTIRTYWVDMNRPTGRVTYPPNARGGESARGIRQEFRHVVIQYRKTANGNETMHMFEPSRPAPRDATPVPQIATAR